MSFKVLRACSIVLLKFAGRSVKFLMGVMLLLGAGITGSAVQQPVVPKQSPVIEKLAAFDHKRKEHLLPCSSCHTRTDNKATQNFPYHTACIQCHVSDFTSAKSQLCAGCHQLPLKATVQTVSFPGKLDEFGVHKFLHRTHVDPVTMKRSVGCVDCHKFDAAKFQVSYPGHPECFSCHTHEAGQKLGTCETCHTFRASATLYAKGFTDATYQYNFKHSTHLPEPSIRNNCQKCHQFVLATVGQESDITEIKTIREFNGHTSDCWQCHRSKTELQCTQKCHIKGLPVT